MPLEFISPDWPAPKHIRCVSTTRIGGFSENGYQSFNLGEHVKDSQQHVVKNRELLSHSLQLPNGPIWLNQVHGTEVLELNSNSRKSITADAAYTNEAGVVCAVLTADCLPVVFCDKGGEHIAVAHAGWRGLVNGIIENTLQSFPMDNENIICWLGPAIGSNKFEVGQEVYDEFLSKDDKNKNAFIAQGNGKHLANIYQLAKNVLYKHSVQEVYGGGYCTYSEKDRFYSYRRDGETGRMSTLVWKS